MEIRNRAQAVVAKAFKPGEWEVLCADPQFRTLLEHTITVEQIEETIAYGSQFLETYDQGRPAWE